MKPLNMLAALNLPTADGDGPRRFRILAYTGGLLRVNGFKLPVVVDLAGLEASGKVSVLLDHKNTTDTTLGQVADIANDGRQLTLSGPITGNHLPAVQRVIAQAAAGHQWNASIGCLVDETVLQTVPAGQTVTVNGKTFRGPIYVSRKSDLRETSVLAMGADSSTSVNLAAQAAQSKGFNMDFETWLKDEMGIEPANLKDAGREMMMQKFTSLQSPPETAEAAAIVNLRASGSAELRRQAHITAVASRHPMIAAKAIDLGWTPEETELQVLRASRAPVPPGHRSSGGEPATTTKHLTAALMIQAGFSAAAEKTFGETVMEQSKPLHACGMPDLCRAALRMDGREIPHQQGEMLRAAMSTGSLPTALGNTANMVMTTAYQQAPASWRGFATVKPAANFKTQTSIRPSFGGDLIQVPKASTVEHGKMEEETYEWSIDTFAKQYQVDYRDFADDAVGIFSDIIPGFARTAARTLNSLVIRTILANASSFYSAANLNYFEGAATNLQASSLATAIKMLRQMKDAESNLLDLEPATLLVPPELEQIALALINSTEVQRDASDDNQPTGNALKGIAKLIVEARLSDSTFTNSSAVGWYLFSAAVNAAVVVGFLNGQETPTIESFGLNHNINVLAYGWRIYHSFGCALADQRSSIRSKGQA